MNEIKWGIIGCGDVTEVKSGPAFNKVPNSSLHGVMRRDAIKAEDYAKRHNVPVWYTDAEKLINDPDINAIYVATPPLYHEEYCLAALQAGKPVYVEKPMAISKLAAIRMKHAAEKSGIKLSVAHYRRQLPLFLKIKELLQEQVIGEIKMVNLMMLQPHNAPLITQTHDNWRVDPTISGGGLFHDLAPHQLDLMLYFFGNAINGSGVSLNQGGFYNAADMVHGHLLFPKNILFQGTWCFTVPPAETKDHCEIIGSKGKLSFSIFNHEKLYVTIVSDVKEYHFENLPHVQQPIIEKVVQYFLGNAGNPCSASEGVAVMEMMEMFTGNGQ
ncbi:Gfo/Idh/MocA family protein [Aridibaculum aurantiacum]|uniref:Gfo/Idh/MocA family protein n=1 Tax=Aridibaculum aurantiacum TaxID=2810307 RepID=UPI001A95B858|nr:Gfo/Idh/MocA family oxidoreductase [Aridibaculum aurantiacum]